MYVVYVHRTKDEYNTSLQRDACLFLSERMPVAQCMHLYEFFEGMWYLPTYLATEQPARVHHPVSMYRRGSVAATMGVGDPILVQVDSSLQTACARVDSDLLSTTLPLFLSYSLPFLLTVYPFYRSSAHSHPLLYPFLSSYTFSRITHRMSCNNMRLAVIGI